MRYAFFPGSRRLAIQVGGQVRVYDTGNHMLTGFSQAQSGDQSLTFNSQYGIVRVADLPLAPGERLSPAPPPPAPFQTTSLAFAEPQPTAAAVPPPAPPSVSSAAALPVDEILKLLEGLGALRDKGVLTDAEFAAKKAELLTRI